MIYKLSLTLLLLSCLFSFSQCQTPTKPVWPTQFSSPFGLFNSAISPVIANESSTLLYHYESDLQSQVIVYPERCVRLVAKTDSYPCNLYFNPKGIYLNSPGFGKQCCLAIPDVGAIPPAFLDGFDFTSANQSAQDFYNHEHTCNLWTGDGILASGFKYWTDQTTGFDVYFADGGTGNYWAWGDFNVTSQPAELFNLPGSDSECGTLCILEDEKIAYTENYADKFLGLDPMLDLAIHHAKLRRLANK